MHHKRKRPKSARAGCLLCKPHKRQGAPVKSRCRHSVLKAMARHMDGRKEWRAVPSSLRHSALL